MGEGRWSGRRILMCLDAACLRVASTLVLLEFPGLDDVVKLSTRACKVAGLRGAEGGRGRPDEE